MLLAINQKDMLQLRGLSVTASLFGIAYNLLQPVPLWAPAAWGAFFISCHVPLEGSGLSEIAFRKGKMLKTLYRIFLDLHAAVRRLIQ